ncbi:hypothetical protein [Prescottella agglutinans]|uniref:Uncharacterized protein n=1 Tax=Prescottella agglutinans TaxID=1644129 RepID=A0ABT6MLL2_9NOCA|nr:hypothetical protein [Prescottella agglutinans]MDH6284289.1 hypothetical protein [Prescottella agglutinans]
MTQFSAQELLDSGARVICRGCNWLVDASFDKCRKCGHPLKNDPAPKSAAPHQAPRKRPPARKTTSAERHRGDAVLTDAALGGMADRADRTIWLVVHGDPKPQGSMVAVAAGRVKASDPKMYAWRDNITGEALRELGVQWRPIDGPALIDVAFTMPFPRSFEDQSGRIAPRVAGELPRIPAMQPPDRDKLLRAVQDALSPNDRGNKGGNDTQAFNKRFKLAVDDSRFVYGAEAKSYARPGHTHAWALDRPGAVIRVRMIDAPGTHFPEPTLRDPGPLPDQIRDMHERLLHRPGGVAR